MSASYDNDMRDMRYERDEHEQAKPTSKLWLIASLIALTAASTGAWFYFQNQAAAPSVQPPAPPVAAAPAAPAPAVAATSQPQIKFPIDQAQTASTEKAAPATSLLESDTLARDAITKLIGIKRMAQFFLADDIIRRVVATVDNLPRERAAANMRPTKGLGQTSSSAFMVNRSGESLTLSPDNSARYAAWVQLAESVNTNALVAAYVRMYPLFQEAYKELGYPKGYFNDRLIEAIDNALAAPTMGSPIALTQPRVMYQYADPKLEALSAGQKIMLRMGSANAARVKAKLTDIRAALVGKGLH
jgi:Protein of unknown function (DUF3014)